MVPQISMMLHGLDVPGSAEEMPEYSLDSCIAGVYSVHGMFQFEWTKWTLLDIVDS